MPGSEGGHGGSYGGLGASISNVEGGPAEVYGDFKNPIRHGSGGGGGRPGGGVISINAKNLILDGSLLANAHEVDRKRLINPIAPICVEGHIFGENK